MTITENKEVLDVMLERPIIIYIGKRKYFIRPLSLGKTMYLGSLLKRLEINYQSLLVNLHGEVVRLCHEKEDVVCYIIAVFITDKRNKIFDTTHINALAEYVKKKLSTAEKATILELYFNEPTASKYAKILGIEAEKEKATKIQKAKEKDSSIQIGGVSIFGAIIDAACERYKWTYQYVLWGLSYNALQLMMADALRFIYLSEKDRKKINVPLDGIVLSGDKAADIETMKKLIEQ